MSVSSDVASGLSENTVTPLTILAQSAQTQTYDPPAEQEEHVDAFSNLNERFQELIHFPGVYKYKN